MVIHSEPAACKGGVHQQHGESLAEQLEVRAGAAGSMCRSGGKEMCRSACTPEAVACMHE